MKHFRFSSYGMALYFWQRAYYIMIPTILVCILFCTMTAIPNCLFNVNCILCDSYNTTGWLVVDTESNTGIHSTYNYICECLIAWQWIPVLYNCSQLWSASDGVLFTIGLHTVTMWFHAIGKHTGIGLAEILSFLSFRNKNWHVDTRCTDFQSIEYICKFSYGIPPHKATVLSYTNCKVYKGQYMYYLDWWYCLPL